MFFYSIFLYSSKKSASSSSNSGEANTEKEVYSLKQGRLAPPGKDSEVKHNLLNQKYFTFYILIIFKKRLSTEEPISEALENIEIDEYETDHQK